MPILSGCFEKYLIHMLGGGAGSIQDMIVRYRNNMAMLRKKSIFKRDHDLFSKYKNYLKISSNTELQFKTPTTLELDTWRIKFLKQKRLDRIKTIIANIILLSIIAIAITLITKSITKEIKIENQNRKQESIATYNMKRKEYLYFIQEGDNWLQLNYWNYAIFQYKTAIDIMPEEFEARFKLASAYTFSCRAEDRYCDEAIILLNQLIDNYPNNKNLYEMKANYYLSKKDTVKALKVYNEMEVENKQYNNN